MPRTCAWLPAPRAFGAFSSTGSVSELLQDVLGEALVDLAVPRHGLGNPGAGIAIPIVLAAAPHEHTSVLLQAADQVLSLHEKDSSATRRTPGISPLVRSLNRSFRWSWRSSRL